MTGRRLLACVIATVNDNDYDLDHTVVPGLFAEPNPEQVDVFAAS